MTTSTKTPQDRKPSKNQIEEAKNQRFDEIEGHELLRPFSEIDGFTQLDLLEKLKILGLDENDGDLDLSKARPLIEYVVENFALDQNAVVEWSRGPGGAVRLLKLTISYAGEVGKDAA